MSFGEVGQSQECKQLAAGNIDLEPEIKVEGAAVAGFQLRAVCFYL